MPRRYPGIRRGSGATGDDEVGDEVGDEVRDEGGVVFAVVFAVFFASGPESSLRGPPILTRWLTVFVH